MGAQYIGTEPGVVRIDDKPVLPGDVVTAPADVVAELQLRGDFIATDMIAELEEPPAKKPKKKKGEE